MNKELKKLLEDDRKCKEAIKERDQFLENHKVLCTTVVESESDYDNFKSFLKKAKIDFFEKEFVQYLNMTYTYEGYFHTYSNLYSAPSKYDKYLFLANGDKTDAEATIKAYFKYRKMVEKKHTELVNSKAKKILEKLFIEKK